MKRKLLSGCLVLGALLVLLGGTVLLRYIQNRQGKLFRKESYDENGLLVVSIKTHPELFEYMGMIDPLEFEECKPGKSGIELEFRYTETIEDGKEIEKEDVYDLFDPALLKADWLNMWSLGWSLGRMKTAAKEDTGVLLRFTSGEIEKPYRLCVPDTFEGKPVFSIFQIDSDSFLERIDYPDSIQSINISNCSNLKEINYSKNVRDIAISDCDALTSVRIPEHKNIPSWFHGVTECNGIEELIIPDNYLVIGNIACSCGGLRRVELKEGLMVINESFNNCPLLEEVYIPDSVIMILNSFTGCERIVLSVGKGSAAEKYAQAKEIPFVYHE